jgi:hypothetical protein
VLFSFVQSSGDSVGTVSTAAGRTHQDGALLVLALWKTGATGPHTAKDFPGSPAGQASTSLWTVVFDE